MANFHELFINDVSAGTYGIWLEKAPAIPIAAERGTWQTMPGVDGGFFVSEGALDSVELELNIYVDAGRDLNMVVEYLLGAQTVRVSPWLWEWEVYTQDCEPMLTEWLEIPGEGFEGTIVYKAKPYRIVWPHDGVDMTISYGQTVTINNPYAVALPVITLTYGTTMTIDNMQIKVSGSQSNQTAVTIDCEKHTIDHPERITMQYLNGDACFKWPSLNGGNTTITTSSNGYGGTIKARWRRR